MSKYGNGQAPAREIAAALKVAFVFGTLVLSTKVELSGQTFTTLASFDQTNGGGPFCGGGSSLTQGTDGELYGTTQEGGAYSLGTVFKVSLQGAITALHSFHGSDGSTPCAGLLLANDGNFYGVTSAGGLNGYGTVFKITRQGVLATLHSFDNTDGATPVATLIQSTSGVLYGTTQYGGASNSGCSSSGCGTVFAISTAGVFERLHSFGPNDGTPAFPLIQSASGSLYGTTQQDTNSSGLVFQITPTGEFTTVVNFNGYNGGGPNALTAGANGNIYGTTKFFDFRGSQQLNGEGSIFDLGQGKLQTLFLFCTSASCVDDPPNGGSPTTGLTQGTDGNFYGTTPAGGPYKSGNIFQFSPSGTFNTLYDFYAGETDSSGLVQATDGNFYGTAYVGGFVGNNCPFDGCGEVFQLSVGLPPFVTSVPSSGAIGSTVRILGTDLAGATSVTFNGEAASFTVSAPTEIIASVPAGAISGIIQVVTPTATLASNVPFQVR